MKKQKLESDTSDLLLTTTANDSTPPSPTTWATRIRTTAQMNTKKRRKASVTLERNKLAKTLSHPRLDNDSPSPPTATHKIRQEV